MTTTAVAPSEEIEVVARQSFEELGVPGVDGTMKVVERTQRVNHAPRSFEQPTETFARKTGMRDKGPPGYEYNNTDHLSVSAVAKKGSPGSAVFLAASDNRGSEALPGVRVRAYPTTPTRDDRLEAAEAAAAVRAEEARRMAIKSRRDRKILLATAAASEPSPGRLDKPGVDLRKPASGLATKVIRQPRSQALEDRAWREALEAKVEAIAASPREGKTGVGKSRDGGNRRMRRKGPATAEKSGMYHGIKVPLDAFEKPFAGGSALDALPGRLESLIFPQRYVDWPKENAALPALALDVKSSPIRHAVAFRSKQPRIVCYDPQRETRGWDGPGAYEWDDRPPDDIAHTATPSVTSPDTGAGDTEGRGEATGMSGGGGGGGGSGGGGRNVMGTRPRGISVRDPDRLSPAFREGSSGFVPPTQTNVRGFATSPSTGAAAPDSSGGGGGGAAAPGNKNQGGRRKKPQRLWMFHRSGKEVRPALATENWDGPGAYAIGIETGVRVKEPERKSPVFLEGSGGKRGREADRRDRESWISSARPSPGGHPEACPITSTDGGRESPGTPDILANWSSPYLEFTPPEPKTLAHGLRRLGPNRFGACFLSLTERFSPDTPFGFTPVTTPPGLGPGAGERSNGGEMAGPVERYDLVSSRPQPPAANTWLGTSIRPGLPYNPSLKADDTGAARHHRDRHRDHHHHHRPSSSFSPLSPPHVSREEDGGTGTAVGDASETPTSDRNSASVSGAGSRRRSNDSPELAPLALAAVGKRVRSTPTPGWVLSLPPSGATAAIAAAGLARSWAGRGAGGGDSGAGSGETICGAEGDGGGVAGGGGGGGGGGGAIEGTRGGIVGGGGRRLRLSGSDREEEPRPIRKSASVSKEKGSGRDTATLLRQPAESIAFSAAVAAGKSLAVSEDRRVAAALHLAHTHHQQQRRRHKPRRNRFKAKHQPSTSAASAASAMAARGVSFNPFGGSGSAPSTGGNATGKTATSASSSSATVVVAMTEEGLAAAELSRAAAAKATAAERERGLIQTVGRPKRGPCMFTPAISDAADGWASSTRTTLLLGKGGGSGGGGNSSSSTKGLGPAPRPLWEAEAAGGLLGPGETKVLVC
eukprot:g16022.t1